MGGFTHLHVHTQFSLLDGAARISDLVAKAKGDALLSAGSKPYIALRLGQKTQPLEALREFFGL